MYHLIVNPVAGRGRSRKALAYVEKWLEQHHHPYQRYLSHARGHAADIAAALPADATILVLGGDGTVHEVAQSSLHTQRRIAILPTGSGDDFAYALGLSRHDIGAALLVLQAGKTRWLDTGQVNGEVFVNSFGVGFDAEVAQHVLRAPAWLQGKAAYLYAILRSLSHIENAQVEIFLDGKRFYAGKSLLVGIQNGKRTGGSYLFAPEARLDDGVFNVIVGEAFGIMGIVGIMPRLLKGTHHDHGKVHVATAQHIRLEWDTPRAAHMEGELLEVQRNFEITLEPQSLQVFCP